MCPQSRISVHPIVPSGSPIPDLRPAGGQSFRQRKKINIPQRRRFHLSICSLPRDDYISGRHGDDICAGDDSGTLPLKGGFCLVDDLEAPEAEIRGGSLSLPCFPSCYRSERSRRIPKQAKPLEKRYRITYREKGFSRASATSTKQSWKCILRSDAVRVGSFLRAWATTFPTITSVKGQVAL